MREITKRCLSVLLAVAVVGAGAVAFVNLDQGPEPVDQYGAVQEGEAIAPLAVAGVALIAGGGGLAAGAYFSDDVDEDAIRGEDDRETHFQIYQSAASTADNGESTTEIFGNWMQDGAMIGRMEGQNAYIRELENGSTETVARSSAKAAANDWFAERQVRLINRYEKSVVDWRALHNTAESEANSTWADSMWEDETGETIVGTHNFTTTLANGSQIEYMTFDTEGGSGGEINVFFETTSGLDGSGRSSVFKTAPSPDYERLNYMNGTAWFQAWNATKNSKTEALNEIDNFVDATYSKYETGVINSSDLITPSLADRNYSPDGDAGTFTQTALTRMGFGLPTDFSNTKEMEITADGTSYTGVLLSDGVPSGGFEIGKNYSVSNLAGAQVVQHSDGMVTAEETVRIDSVTRTDGTTKDSGTVSYTSPDYESADSLEGYKALMQNISETQAQINARQKKLLNDSSGTGETFPDLGGLPFGGAGVVVAILVLLGMAAVGRSN